jgi:hypothetical protein
LPRKKKKRKASSPGVAKAKKQIKLYFNEDTQLAIEEFQKTSCPEEQNEIYASRILPAFEKLSENLIFIHKFSSLHDTYEDLKNDCVCFLYETLYKFDASRGTKAFSYFNVVAKNFLIIKSKQRTTSFRRNVSMDDRNSFSISEKYAFSDYNVAEDPASQIIREEEKKMNLDMISHLQGESKSDNEKACINAIKSLFETADELEFLNKRAVFVYLREISGLTPKQLTTTISNLKKKYRALKEKDEFRIFFE